MKNDVLDTISFRYLTITCCNQTNSAICIQVLLGFVLILLKLKVSSIKSSNDINENENMPYRGFGY